MYSLAKSLLTSIFTVAVNRHAANSHVLRTCQTQELPQWEGTCEAPSNAPRTSSCASPALSATSSSFRPSSLWLVPFATICGWMPHAVRHRDAHS